MQAPGISCTQLGLLHAQQAYWFKRSDFKKKKYGIYGILFRNWYGGRLVQLAGYYFQPAANPCNHVIGVGHVHVQCSCINSFFIFIVFIVFIVFIRS